MVSYMRRYLSLKEIQEEEVNILKKTLIFLNENNIKYYIFAGTFLGAVRHSGFIPWDDDIDLCMVREEYDKLIKVLSKNAKIADDIFAIGYEIGNSDWPYIKIVNKNIFVDLSIKHDKNLWIDLFPLDNVVLEDKRFFKKWYKMKLNYVRKCEDLYDYKPLYNNMLKRIVRKLYLLMLRTISMDNYVNKYISFCSKYKNDTGFLFCHWLQNSNQYICRNELIDKTYKFEGLNVNGLKDYDKILTRFYGDYMKIPSEEERRTHEFKAWYNYEE